MSVLDTIGHVLKTGFDLTNLGQRYEAFQSDKKDAERRRQAQDLEFADFVNAKGAVPVMNGIVHRDGFLEKADPSRIVKHKTAEGDTVSWQLPTPEEQRKFQAKALMDQFESQAPMRAGIQQEEAAGAGAKETAIQGARNTARQQQLEQTGVPIPAALEQVLPGITGAQPLGTAAPIRPTPEADTGGRSLDRLPVGPARPSPVPGQTGARRVLPSELDNIIQSAGSFANYQSEIAKRNQPKALAPIGAPHITEDRNGKQTAIVMLNDGTIKEQPLAATGKGEKVPELTPYQKWQMARTNKQDAEKNAAAKPLDPASKEYRVAQDLAYGRLTFANFRSLYAYNRDSNAKVSIYNQAAELNPNFNPAAFEMGFTLAKNPRVQQQLASMDNVQRAVPDLLKLSDEAVRTGVPILNNAIIKGGAALGGKRYSNLQTARTAFADELSGALGFGSATDMSREMGLDMTNPNLSPTAFKSAIEEVVVPFIARKRKSLLDQMGIYGQEGMNPAAANSQGSAAAGGAVPTVNTKAEYDKLPSGAVYVDSQDGKQYRKK